MEATKCVYVHAMIASVTRACVCVCVCVCVLCYVHALQHGSPQMCVCACQDSKCDTCVCYVVYRLYLI